MMRKKKKIYAHRDREKVKRLERKLTVVTLFLMLESEKRKESKAATGSISCKYKLVGWNLPINNEPLIRSHNIVGSSGERVFGRQSVAMAQSVSLLCEMEERNADGGMVCGCVCVQFSRSLSLSLSLCVCVCVREREREKRFGLNVKLPVFYEENLGVGPASELACNAAMGLQTANAIVSAMQVQDGAIGDRLGRCQPKGLQD